MKKIFIILSLFFFLLSCSEKQKEEIKVDLNSAQIKTNINNKVEKIKENKIKTIKIKDLSNIYTIKKGWRIIESDYINIKSEVYGWVKKVLVKEWQKVKKWESIIKLSDINSTYSSKLDKESTNLWDLEKKFEEKKMELDNKIYSLEDELEQLKEEYAEETKQAKITLLTAEVEYEKAKNTIWISESNPKVLRLNEKIKELEYEYMDVVKENKNKFNWYISDINKTFSSTKLQLDNLNNFSNNLFNKENSFYSFIWAKDKTQKLDTINYLSIFDWNINKYKNISIEDLNEWNIVQKIEDTKFIYTETLNYIEKLGKVLDNSILSIWILEEDKINNLKQELKTIRNFIQTTNSNYLNLLDDIKDFLSTYKEIEVESYNRFDLLKKEKQEFLDNFYSWEEDIVNSYNKKVQEIEETLDGYELKIKKLEEKLTSAQIEKGLVINKLWDNLKQAENNYAKTSDEISKFNIVSPIDGIISLIEVNKGDIVWKWDSLIKMSSKDKTEVKVLLKEKEFNMINIWQEVKIKHYDKSYKGVVYLKSDKKDENNNYSVIIVLDDVLKLSWTFVKVEFIFNNTKTIIPKKYIKITWAKTWTLEILDKKTNKTKTLKILIWKAFDDGLEINWVLNNKGKIVSLKWDIELIKK